jgi:hypothetical protein
MLDGGFSEDAPADAKKKMSWQAWATIGFGTFGTATAGWALFQKRIAPKGNGLHEVDTL